MLACKYLIFGLEFLGVPDGAVGGGGAQLVVAHGFGRGFRLLEARPRGPYCPR